jgi:hypothetical protein
MNKHTFLYRQVIPLFLILILTSCSDIISQKYEYTGQPVTTSGKPDIDFLIQKSYEISNELKDYQYNGISFDYNYDSGNIQPNRINIRYKKQQRILGIEISAYSVDIGFDLLTTNAIYTKINEKGNYFNFDTVKIPNNTLIESVISTVNNEAKRQCYENCDVHIFQASMEWNCIILDPKSYEPIEYFFISDDGNVNYGKWKE